MIDNPLFTTLGFLYYNRSESENQLEDMLLEYLLSEKI